MSEKQTDFLATVGAVYSDGVTLIFDGQTQATTKRYKVNKSASFASGQRVKVVKIFGTYIVEYPVASQSNQSGGTGGAGDGEIDLMGDQAVAFAVVRVADLEEGTTNFSVSEILEFISLGRGVMFRWDLADNNGFMDYYLYKATSERVEFRSQIDYDEDGNIDVSSVTVYDGNHFYTDQILINQEPEVELVHDWDGECSLTTAEIYQLSTMAKTVIFRDLGDFENEETNSYALWRADEHSAEFRSPVFISDTGEASVKVVYVSEPNIITREVQTITGGSGIPDCTAADNGKFLQVVDGKPAWVALINVAEVGM